MGAKSNLSIWLFGWLFLRSVNAQDFQCPSPGRHLDEKSDCQNYYLCFPVNGTLQYYHFRCPAPRLFSREEGCIEASNLECKEFIGVTQKPESEIPFEQKPDFVCKYEGKFVNPYDTECKTYFTCIQSPQKTYNLTKHDCPIGEMFSHTIFECVSNKQYKCPVTASSSPEGSEGTTAASGVTSSAGSTEDPTSSESSATSEESSSVASTEGPTVTAPAATSSSESSATSEESSSVASTEGPTVTSPAATSSETSAPTGTSAAATEETTSASTEGRTSTTSAATSIETSAPTGTSPAGSDGTSNEPPSTITTSPETTCTEEGRVPNKDVPDCRGYILCVKESNGTFNRQYFTCGESYFNHITKACDYDYSCQENSVTSPTTVVSEQSTSQTATPPSNVTEGETWPSSTDYTTVPAIESTTNSANPTMSDPTDGPIDVSTYPPECMAAAPKEQFNCLNTGRFKDPESKDCKTYIWCLKTVAGGNYVYARMPCNGDTIYSDKAKACVPSTDYICQQ